MARVREVMRPVGYQTFVQGSYSKDDVISSFCHTLTYMIADAFMLEADEITWVNYKVRIALEPVAANSPMALPNLVSHELATKTYSKNLDRLLLSQKQKASVKAPDESVLDDWLDAFMEMVLSSYDMSIMKEAQMRAEFSFIFNEIGIDTTKNSRVAFYLPRAVKWSVEKRRKPTLVLG